MATSRSCRPSLSLLVFVLMLAIADLVVDVGPAHLESLADDLRGVVKITGVAGAILVVIFALAVV